MLKPFLWMETIPTGVFTKWRPKKKAKKYIHEWFDNGCTLCDYRIGLLFLFFSSLSLTGLTKPSLTKVKEEKKKRNKFAPSASIEIPIGRQKANFLKVNHLSQCEPQTQKKKFDQWNSDDTTQCMRGEKEKKRQLIGMSELLFYRRIISSSVHGL